jgi:CheY-like chemotaxis protein
MAENIKNNLPPRIMVVDDEADILSVIKRVLESENDFVVDVFSNGEEALANLAKHPSGYYDLIITDIRMPKLNGFELYRRIKEDYPSLKIVFITAFEINKDEFSKVIPSVDVTDFITKPVSISTLRSKIKSIILSNYVNTKI